ncbi:PLP-dependent transferase [Aaosphaeria arxii CBS 175.79]|uniref:PLP-dependent transferase n=1 Tax=Aaosphaeria arxii CBS 175.79 TaxID=1450172 RepID=A0A6A5Y5E2_9PLEO|nr:PLP-dependent transferase [Aaosphaeria arxii CBS 175.79]KAF2020496.1 PLP-dependent transferase [Aaosphaeria arxii CBS 175.79]
MLQKKLTRIKQARETAKPLPGGIAPLTSSNDFKSQSVDSKPAAKILDHHFSTVAGNLTVSYLKAAQTDQQHPDLITLGTARPSPQYSPWQTIQTSCLSSDFYDPLTPPSLHLTTQPCVQGENAYDLALAMNYGHSTGSPQVLRFLTEHMELLHDPPYRDWEVCLTCGTTSGLEIALRLLCNPGDTLLAEMYTYTGAIACARSQGVHVLGLEMDEEGIVPSDLDRKLSEWDTVARGPKPHVLYTIPTAQNPTGVTQSVERRKAIYEVAEKHDLFVLEDDPYFYLPLSEREASGGCSSDEGREHSVDGSDLEGYLAELPCSYLSLDTSGRVLRLDSASKILAPGLRTGWVTGSSQVIKKFTALTEVGALCPSGPSQVMLYKLLDETWGHEGFLRWLMNLAREYGRRRNVLIRAMREHMPEKWCRWRVPDVGMFVWVEVDVSDMCGRKPVDKHSLWEQHLEVEEAIFEQARDNGVLVSRGSWFTSDVTKLHRVAFRLTLAAAPVERIDIAAKRFANAIWTVISRIKNRSLQ